MKFRIIDSHCDTLNIMLNEHIDMKDTYNHVSFKGLEEGNIGIQVFAAWIDAENTNYSPYGYAMALIDIFQNLIAENTNMLMNVLNYKDAKRALSSSKIGCLLAVEGGDALNGSLENLDVLYNLGVRLMTLTWNNANEISAAIATDTSHDTGLTPFGRRVVSRMNELGMIIDISHISQQGFWDVCEISNAPIVASHSNAKHICKHRRNLDNEQIKAIAKSDGLIGINFYPPFLTDNNEADIEDILRHIDYIAGLVGIDYIGFGSDFDGIGSTPRGIAGPEDFPKIIEGLLKLNYSEDQIMKICNKNMMRVLKVSLK
ncbi:MAG: membrane dipeptidase [Clostridiales bacterium]|nr:membrane dipeptidase [Clostridiales bacterium]